MDNTEILSKTKLNKIVTYTKYLLVIFTLLTSVPLLHHWFYNGFKIIGLWSMFLAAVLVVKNNKYFRKKEYITLFLFCISYFATVVLSEKAHFINEILIGSYLVMTFFVMTYCDKSITKKDIKEELVKISWIVVIMTMIYSIINFIMYVIALVLNTDLAWGKYIYGMVEGFGLKNDAHGGNWHRQISLLSFEKIEDFKARGVVDDRFLFNALLCVPDGPCYYVRVFIDKANEVEVSFME